MSRQPPQQRPYQGYPYVSPMVIDAPSVGPEAAAMWANLPRRQVGIPERRPTVQNTGDNQVTQEDLEKKKADDAPVVYIDIPEAGGSGLTQNRTDSQNTEPAFVQETILYDPFEDRRIDLTGGGSVKSRNSCCSDSSGSITSAPTQRPTPPNTLTLTSAASTSSGPGMSALSQASYLSKEALVYGSHPDDSFPLSPIPMSDMPKPPPAYTEIDTTPVTQQPTNETRTRVILPSVPTPQSPMAVPTLPSPVGLPSGGRKFVRCQHFGADVVTMVIKETGHITHIMAVICFIVCVPVVLCIYLTNYLKHTNHYCPNCNKKIGFQYPIIDTGITYTNK